MKTKLLFSSMALATIFVGCSDEQFSNITNNTTDLNNRRVAGQVTVDFNSTSSRIGQNENGQIVLSDNDVVGASLMDEFTGTYPVTNLVNYIQTNYPFTKVDDVWKSTGVLLEGNYFFTYPFNACVQDRGALTNTVPVDQLAYDENNNFNAWQSYFDNQFYAGYKYIHADDDCVDCEDVPALNVNVKLEKVHAYPVFKFTNQTGAPLDQPLKVYKLSLRKQDHSMFYNTVAVFPKAKQFVSDPTGDNANEYGKYNLWKTAIYNPNNGDNVDATTPFGSDVVNSRTLEYNVLFPEGGYQVQNWADFEVTMVVPAGLYGPMEVVLYTNEGVGTYPVFGPENGEDYQVQSGVYKLSPERKSETSIRIDINSLKTNKTNFTVQSTENFVEYLEYIKNAGNSLQVIVNTVGDKVELSQEVYDILKNKNIKLRLNGILNIPAGVPADAIDRINFYDNGAVLVNKGVQTITESPVKDKFSLAESNVKVINFGDLTVKADMPNSLITNYGTMNVENATILNVVNASDETMHGSLTVNDQLNVLYLLNMSDMTIAEGATVNVYSSFSNVGTLTNNGKLNIWPGRIVDEVLFDKLLFDVDVNIDNLYNIIVNKKFYSAFIQSDASATNAGVINNNGIIDSKGFISVGEYTQITDIFNITEVNDYTDHYASVTSLVNMGMGQINNNEGGRITNLSNFAYLTPYKKSYTSMAIMSELPSLIINYYDAIKYYLQQDFVANMMYNQYGFIDMSKNDGVKVSDQAQIVDNTQKIDIDKLTSHNQYIYVLRNKVDFNVSISETDKSAPKYINTIWLLDAEGEVSGDTNISAYNLWLSGSNTITVLAGKTLTLGITSIDGITEFRGAGTTHLTNYVSVNNGSTLKMDNTWTADSIVNIYANGANILEGGKVSDNIMIDYNSLNDYVGPWIIFD